MEDKNINSIRKTGLFLISGIFAIIAFFNTAMIEQSKLLEVPQAQMNSIIAWIDSYTLHLLISGIFLLICMLPLYELVLLTSRFFRNEKEINVRWFNLITIVSFLIGSLYLLILFICYVIHY